MRKRATKSSGSLSTVGVQVLGAWFAERGVDKGATVGELRGQERGRQQNHGEKIDNKTHLRTRLPLGVRVKRQNP